MGIIDKIKDASEYDSVEGFLEDIYGKDFLNEIDADLTIFEHSIREAKFKLPQIFNKYSLIETELFYSNKYIEDSILGPMVHSISIDVRNNPQDYGLAKVTDKAVESVTETDSAVIAARAKLNLVNSAHKLMYRIMRAFIMKAEALKYEEMSERSRIKVESTEVFDDVVSDDFKKMKGDV